MKISNLAISCLVTLAFASCKSPGKLTASAVSTAKPVTPKKKTNRKLEFLDQIVVTPGAVVTTRHRTSTTNAKKNGSAAGGPPDASVGFSSVDIERAHWLQLKYAVMIDATVEKLTNIPLFETIDKWWGTKYCLGGATDNCIDCSAFTQIIMRDVYKQSLPRTAQEQYQLCEKVDLEDVQEGDLVFFHTSGRNISHVGIYLINNKFVHAASSGGVMISDLNDKYWQPRFRGAGRIAKQSGS